MTVQGGRSGFLAPIQPDRLGCVPHLIQPVISGVTEIVTLVSQVLALQVGSVQEAVDPVGLPVAAVATSCAVGGLIPR